MENWGGLRSISILFKSVLQTENVPKAKDKISPMEGPFDKPPLLVDIHIIID